MGSQVIYGRCCDSIASRPGRKAGCCCVATVMRIDQVGRLGVCVWLVLLLGYDSCVGVYPVTWICYHLGQLLISALCFFCVYLDHHG